MLGYFYIINSKPVQNKILIWNHWVLEIAGHIHPLVLSIGAINFWCAIWYLWD